MSTDGGAPLPDSESDARWLANAIRTVQAPATFLQWYGIGSMVFAALVLTVFLAAPDSVCDPWYQKMVRDQKDVPVEERQQLPPYHQFVKTQQFQWVLSFAVSLVCSFFIAFGAVKMRHLNGYGWSLAASILSIIPCTNSCCCAGLPIGIWALVTLFASDVRLAFNRVGKAGGLEAFSDVGVPRDEPPSRPIRLE
jgi:hypothetical protein